MYAKYVWNDGATIPNVLVDIVALFTTQDADISSLSASCNKTLTVVNANTVKTNWAMFDAFAGTNKVCLRSLNADGLTYKYIVIEIAATPSISIKAYESWNAVSHVGINVSGGYAGVVPVTLYSSNYVVLMATDRYIGVTNSPLVGTQYNLILEFSRDSYMIDSTYPCIAVLDSNSSFFQTINGNASPGAIGVCRVKNPSLYTGDIVSNMVGPLTALIANPNTPNITVTQNGGAYGVGGVRRLFTIPLQLIVTPPTGGEMAYLGEVLGSICVAPTIGTTVANLDEIAIGTDTFILITRNGGSCLLIPKV